ncbi:MAG: hypothetical protein CMO80_23775 [Verrucomicrobiales bacterium]|nr:hypothetical protein [Verrucomicrobiales bacterium]
MGKERLEDEASKNRREVFRRRWLICGVIAFSILGIPIGLRLGGINGLNQRIDEIQSRGETARVADLVPPSFDPTNNAHTVIMVLSNEIENAESVRKSTPKYYRQLGNGVQRSVFEVREWKWSYWDAIGSDTVEATNDWGSFLHLVAPHTNVIQTLLGALQRDGLQSGYDHGKCFADMMDFTWFGMRGSSVNQLMNVGFVYHLRADRIPAAHEHLLGMHRIV